MKSTNLVLDEGLLTEAARVLGTKTYSPAATETLAVSPSGAQYVSQSAGG